jgi:NitT/TauT family transport system substrate-binding protein
MIVSDWIWVLRQHAAGAGFLFHPYSTALGALLVGKDSGISSIEQLAGKRLGIAGGPVDKNWLILQSWATERGELDLEDSLERVFAAPPLLNEHLGSGSLDALLTFWPYAARLEAASFTRLLNVSDILADLGIAGSPSLVGYVFDKRLLEEKPAAVKGFFKALAAANALLARSDEEWLRLRPIMKVGSDLEFEALKAGYRAGIPLSPDEETLEDARRLFEILAETGGEKLLGPGTTFDPAIFWSSPQR